MVTSGIRNAHQSLLENSDPVIRPPMIALARVFIAAVLFAIFAFSLFGFLASFEPGPSTLIWATGYAIAGLLSISGAIALVWPASPKNRAR